MYNRAITQVEEIVILLKKNAFVSLGTFFVIALTLVLGALKAQNSRIQRRKKNVLQQNETAAVAAVSEGEDSTNVPGVLTTTVSAVRGETNGSAEH